MDIGSQNNNLDTRVPPAVPTIPPPIEPVPTIQPTDTPNLRPHVIMFTLSLLAFLALGGYTWYTRIRTENGGPVAYSYTLDIDSIEDDTIVEQEPVEGFPIVPEYPNSEIKDSARHLHGETLEYHTRWRSSDDIEAILSWYQDALAQEGWTTIAPLVTPDQITLNATKDHLSLYLQLDTAERAITFLYSDPEADERDAESEDEGDETLTDNLITMSVSYEVK